MIPGFFITTRVTVTCTLSMRAILTPRIIRGDDMPVPHCQLVTPVRGVVTCQTGAVLHVLC